MTTAGDQINGALRLIGVIAEGETASAETTADALSALNQMLDSWSAEKLKVYATQDQSFTWPASTATRTIGPSGNFVGIRPIALEDSTYFVDADTNISFPIKIINQAQYNAISKKDVTSTYPQVLFVNYDMPDATMTLYPVPSKALTFHFISVDELSQPATLATSLSFPPGYIRAFKYGLACEIAAEFGLEPLPSVQRIAMTSLRAIKRVNQDDSLMAIPANLMTKRPRFNIFAGNF